MASRFREGHEVALVDRAMMAHRAMQPPVVSVIIPAYNAEGFIAEAIQSVLEQTYQSYEIIVVDDGSTDKTKDILKGFNSQICCLYQENRGPSAARNAGIAVSQGTYICFLDSDDLWIPHKLEAQLEFLESHQDIDLVFSDHQDFAEEDEDFVVPCSFLDEKKKRFGEGLVTEVPIHDAFLKLVQENFISTPTVMLKKTCFGKVGLFDENLWSVEDRDLWLRVAVSFNLACLPRVFCKRRIHKSNISKESELTLYARIKVLEKNRRDFPHFIPSEIWDSELANHYCQIGYILLQKGLRRKALKAGFTSLGYALRQLTKDRVLSLNSWSLVIGLIPAVLLGWRFSRFLFQPIKEVAGGQRGNPTKSGEYII